jgi:hypothetical protein
VLLCVEILVLWTGTQIRLLLKSISLLCSLKANLINFMGRWLSFFWLRFEILATYDVITKEEIDILLAL